MATVSKFQRAPAKREGEQVNCDAHGRFDAYLIEQFDGGWKARGCPRCHWEAMSLQGVTDEAFRSAMDADVAYNVNSLLIGSGIAERFKHCTFANYDIGDDLAKARVLDICRSYSQSFPERYQKGQSLILSGNVGTGKTHLASAMIQSIVREHMACAVITTAAEIARVVRASFAKGAGYTELDVLEELASVDLLVIDEVGVQSSSDFAPGLMHEVIDRRYQKVVPTIVVTNQLPEALPRFLGDRAVDRLRQGGGRLLSFTWSSARASQ